eukprot:SAG31_NODE_6186_length_2132_cov_1.652238_2_plen_77_part_00
MLPTYSRRAKREGTVQRFKDVANLFRPTDPDGLLPTVTLTPKQRIMLEKMKYDRLKKERSVDPDGVHPLYISQFTV